MKVLRFMYRLIFRPNWKRKDGWFWHIHHSGVAVERSDNIWERVETIFRDDVYGKPANEVMRRLIRLRPVAWPWFSKTTSSSFTRRLHTLECGCDFYENRNNILSNLHHRSGARRVYDTAAWRNDYDYERQRRP